MDYRGSADITREATVINQRDVRRNTEWDGKGLKLENDGMKSHKRKERQC